MTFREAIKENDGLKLLVENLSLNTSLGREKLMKTQFSIDKKWISQQFANTNCVLEYLKNHKNQQYFYTELDNLLSATADITKIVNLLKTKNTLDDISLFEVKSFALNCKKIHALIQDISCISLQLPNLGYVISLLDPEGLETYQFYVFSAYDKTLAELRKDLDDSVEYTEKYNLCLEIESRIRTELSNDLCRYVNQLEIAMDIIAELDLNFAKARLYLNWNLKQPEIIQDENRLEFHSLIYPPLSEKLKEKGKYFQPIDIVLQDKPVLLTGANMAGKTILLKSLAFAQFCFQFGFFVAAENAKMCLMEGILISIGDNQNEEEGLSSFAAEILNVNTFIKLAKTGKRYLILVDELARTTNPYEGKELVRGFINVLATLNSVSLITTHYTVENTDAKRLRVKGFSNKNILPPITISDIAENMDYSLIEDDNFKVPTEAIHLAQLLAIDEDWLTQIHK
ncbi:MAG: hypothetical protein LBR28_06925 [Bacteroidales bacterium]|jgi:dsDNA-specific endonuclease/ATPase MutS2|nr:hypothetical protein [Bacteroidales bacterium]